MKDMTKEQFEALCKQYVILYREDQDDNVKELIKLRACIMKNANKFLLVPKEMIANLEQFADGGEIFE